MRSRWVIGRRNPMCMRTRSALSLSFVLAASTFVAGPVAATGSSASNDDLLPADRIGESTAPSTEGPSRGGAVPQKDPEERADPTIIQKTLLDDEVPSGPDDASVVGTVLIDEVLFNPTVVYDSRGEWFEVVNTTDSTIDLSGWTFGDEIYDIHTISELKIAAGERAVLARVADSARNGGIDVDYEFGDAVLLYNSGDRIVLRNSKGSIVDSVNYGEDSFRRPAGKSISFRGDATRSSAAANDDGANWCSATTTLPAGDFGSPGRITECRSSQASLVINEIMNNPSASSDSVGEWFEVTNTGADIDLAGFSVQDDDNEKFTIDGTLKVARGESVVFGTDGDRTVNGGVDVDVDYGDQMRLHNTFDELVITDTFGIQVDAVRYDDGRTFPDPNGASMQLASNRADNAEGANWCLTTTRWAAGDRGTPGTAGSCDAVELASIAITEIMADPESTSSERQGEWFEIENTGDEAAVLDGYSIAFNSRYAHVITKLTVAPGARAVLAVNGDASANGGIDADYAYGEDIPLFNASGTLSIVSPDNRVADQVTYSATTGFPSEKGHSIELASTSVDNTLGANWCVTIDRYNDLDFGTPGTAGSCDEAAPMAPLQISEVMRNPAVVTDRDGEWFELFNPTSDDVDLRNWSIGDEGSERVIVRESVIVPAEGYAIIARNGDSATNGGVTAALALGTDMVLYNSEDEIVIHDQHGRLVDEVRWSNSDLMPRPNGGSMARSAESLAAFAPTDDASEWCTTSDQFGAGDLGTPGAANTCTPDANHDVAINEIHRDPEQEPDSQGEWIELHNSGDADIDISGWTLRDDDSDTFVFPSNTVISAGDYLTAGRNDASLNGGISMDVVYGIEIINFNTTDELMLFDTDLQVVDRVAWTANNGFPKLAGRTMSLRDATLDNSVGANWCAAVTDQGNGDLGTPGAANLCELPIEPAPGQSTAITHSVYATGACSGDVTLNGSKLNVGTDIRSNDDVIIAARKGNFDGSVSYADQASIRGNIDFASTPVRSSDWEALDYGWSIEDFAPGGVRAVAAGDDYHYYEQNLDLRGNSVSADGGIAYVNGDVFVYANTVLFNEVTIVATGKIYITATKVSMQSFGEDLPALMSGADGCSENGVLVRASTAALTGAVYAPTAMVDMRASVLDVEGGFAGNSVYIQASQLRLNEG